MVEDAGGLVALGVAILVALVGLVGAVIALVCSGRVPTFFARAPRARR